VSVAVGGALPDPGTRLRRHHLAKLQAFWIRPCNGGMRAPHIGGGIGFGAERIRL
jgi:hypothetical protein